MKESSATQSLVTLLGAAAVGAAAMYMSDPDRGRRRRALATDKMRSLAVKTSSALDVASRDLGNRAQGWRAQATRMLSRKQQQSIDSDELMVTRVRKEIGRVVAHPRAIKVNATQGCVSLHGPILAHEKQELIDCVKAITGVSEIDDKLEVHESAAGIPSLQGEGKMRRAASSVMQETWSPALRAIAAVGGGALSLYGLMRRSPASVAMATVGVGLITRGLVNRPFNRLMGRAPAQSIDLHKTIYIDAAPEVVFDQWSRYENFPHFMSNVQEVHDLGNGRSHWIVSGPAGSKVEWDAIMTESERPRVLAWNSERDSTIQHTGSVHFEPAGDGTRVSVHMVYSPPGGAMGHAFASLFNGNPKRQMDEDLMRMKAFIESGVPPQDAAQPMAGMQNTPQQSGSTGLH